MVNSNFILLPLFASLELGRRINMYLKRSLFYRWRYSAPSPERLLAAPQDLRPANAALAVDFYSGHFTFNGITIETKGKSIYQCTPPNAQWAYQLHEFRWLRHLRASQTDLTQANAAAYVSDWISSYANQLDKAPWDLETTTVRFISLLSHAPMLIAKMGLAEYRHFLSSLLKHYRYLKINKPLFHPGYPKLHVKIALALGALCLNGRSKSIRHTSKSLDRELERQILADGGHISRSPIQLLNILADLIPLRELYIKQGIEPSEELLSAIERGMQALQFFRHSNGHLGQFNGCGTTPVELLKIILQFDTSIGSTRQSAPHSGYERLVGKKTVVLMDTGKCVKKDISNNIMAGTLAFEMSCGTTRFITNCGFPEYQTERYLPFARATAAHSTATIGDTSSSHFLNVSKFRDLWLSPVLDGPDQINVERYADASFNQIKASHNGYDKKFNIIHNRELSLSRDGEILNGVDYFTFTNPSPEKTPTKAPSVVLRFHLAPEVQASSLSSGDSILITAKNKNSWIFSCIDGSIKLEESVQFSGTQPPRKCKQIVIYTDLSTQKTIRWTMSHKKAKPAIKNSKKDEMPTLFNMSLLTEPKQDIEQHVERA